MLENVLMVSRRFLSYDIVGIYLIYTDGYVCTVGGIPSKSYCRRIRKM